MGLLAALKIGGLIVMKVVDLHKKGVDQEVIDEIHEFVHAAHEIIDKHHFDHVSSDEEK